MINVTSQITMLENPQIAFTERLLENPESLYFSPLNRNKGFLVSF